MKALKMHLSRLVIWLCFVLIGSTLLTGQESATLTGVVVDPSGAVAPGAVVDLTGAEQGIKRKGASDGSGAFSFISLPPGEYTLEASKTGFKKVVLEHIQLGVRGRQSLLIELKVAAAATATLDVTTDVESISTDMSTGTAIENSYSVNLPINGRGIESLIRMSPGVISAGGPNGDDFNVNGLRSNTNYYTVDGVSANRPLGGSPGGFGGGGGGGFRGGAGAGGVGGGGATGDSIPLDALAEIRVQTSTFAPEFGRSPGAQVAMISRGGTNQFHGTLFEYYRKDALNANDWFANSASFARPEMKQNRFGGAFGGPVVHDRTFFFASFEALRLTAPETLIGSVPDLRTRRAAPAALRTFLNAFPNPNGIAQDGGAAAFNAITSNPTNSNSGSIRLDHRFKERWNAFVRYSNSQTDASSRGSQFSSPNVITSRDLKAQTVTASLATILAPTATNDFRANYSRTETQSASVMDNYGGAVALTPAQVFPSTVKSGEGLFNLTVFGLSGYSLGAGSTTRQEQMNFVDNITIISGRHYYKLGVDFRRTMPTFYRQPYTESISFNGLPAVSTGTATSAVISSNLNAVYPLYRNYSVYGQDTYRATDRTTIMFGLRWDLNPAPGVRDGPRPYSIDPDLPISGVSQQAGLYKTRWFDIAPRIGLAYQMDTTPGKEMVLRLGGGIFFDTGYGITGGAFNGAPYSSVNNLANVAFPLSTVNLRAPVLPPVRPFGQVVAADINLSSPLVGQWNATIERAFGRAQLLSVSYVGTNGRNLLRTDTTPSFSSAYDLLVETTNGATSWYHGLQVQFRRRMTDRLQTQLSYTLGHSIDTASSDVGGGGGFATFTEGNKGDSNYDIRHNLNLSGSYRLASPKNRMLNAIFGDWFVDWVATARTGLPFDVQGITTATSDTTSTTTGTAPRRGIFAQNRPDYTGLPVWLDDSGAPGGKRLNPAAFVAPTGYRQGNLARNAIRGFHAYQIDGAFRRQIRMTEKFRLQLAAQAFNVMNHPNFANPSGQEGANLASARFGYANRMLSQGFGATSTVYNNGGPRMLELTLRLQF